MDSNCRIEVVDLADVSLIPALVDRVLAASAVVPDLVVRLLPARYPQALRLLQGRSRRHAVPASDSALGGSAGH